jgi:predicted nucleotidyltransferase
LSTARVTYFDKAAVRRALDDYVRRLAGHPEVEAVILFGSLASGTPVPGSDVDLVVILTDSDRRFIDRIPAFLPTHFPVAVDVFPYTRAEVERMTREGNPFVQRALREGITLFERSPAAGH